MAMNCRSELVEVEAAEINVGDVADRHTDASSDLAVGHVADQITGLWLGIAQTAY